MSDFALGSRVWPGLSKLLEECGEVVQVGGKLIQTGGAEEHWDGTNLRVRLEEECADAMAAIRCITDLNDLDVIAMEAREERKLALFRKWHEEQADA